MMTMKIQCPNCGKTVKVKGIGRRPLNIPVTKVCDTLQARRNVLAAAQNLNCSRGYVYKVLKANGMTAKGVLL